MNDVAPKWRIDPTLPPSEDDLLLPLSGGLRTPS